MAPTLITSYAVYSASADNTTLVSPSFTPSNGEVIAVKALTWDSANGMSTPTGGGQTFTAAQITTPGGFSCWAGAWWAIVSGSPGAMTVSCAPATGGSTRHSMVVERWSNATVAATPAVVSPAHGIPPPAFTTSITTVKANSVVTWCNGDENSNSPAGATYNTTSGTVTQDGLYDGSAGSNSVQYFAYQTAAVAGANTVGMTAPTNQNWTVAGFEIQAGSTVVTGTATDAFATSDALTSAALLPRATADAFTTADTVTRTAVSPRAPADAFTTTDTPTRTVVLTRTATDAFTTTDATTSAAALHRTPTDSITTTDVVTRAAQTFTRAATDGFTTTDVATASALPAARIVQFTIYPPQLKWKVGPSMPTSLPVISLEYVRVPVYAFSEGAAVNPTTDTVTMAFTNVTGTPVVADWKTARWDTVAVNGVYYAECLVGPTGTTTLAIGQYQVWIKVTDSPEIPARPAGILNVF